MPKPDGFLARHSDFVGAQYSHCSARIADFVTFKIAVGVWGNRVGKQKAATLENRAKPA